MSDSPSLRQRLTDKRRFNEAAREAKRTGGTVCGTYDHDGNPVYFVMPPGASDEEVRAAAFEAREGRPLSKLETQLLTMAEAK